jgi:hypothetical protein
MSRIEQREGDGGITHNMQQYASAWVEEHYSLIFIILFDTTDPLYEQ